jgi:hypothetical protein
MKHLLESTPVLCSILGYLVVYVLVVVFLFRPNEYGIRRRWIPLDYIWVTLGVLAGVGLLLVWWMEHPPG